MSGTQWSDLFFEMRSQVIFDEYTDRELKEIILALVYADDFQHGTDGHNRLILIAKLYRSLRERMTERLEP